MATLPSSGKLFAIVLVLLVGATAAYGYFSQTTVLKNNDAEAAVQTNNAENATLLSVKPTDIVLGDPNALVTVVEYMSLSCTHCAHFHEKVMPNISKEFVTTGNAKIVIRHFPLNAPALAASKLVECAGNNGLDRTAFIKVLFDMQTKWAFDEGYLKNLKQLAKVGGVDSAAFDSCMADKTLETSILSARQDAAKKLMVDSTPYFFINGEHYAGSPDADSLRSAISAALKARTAIPSEDAAKHDEVTKE